MYKKKALAVDFKAKKKRTLQNQVVTTCNVRNNVTCLFY